QTSSPCGSPLALLAPPPPQSLQSSLKITLDSISVPPYRSHMAQTLNREGVIELLRSQCEKAGSLRAWARANNCSAPYVSDVLAGNREPGPKILRALFLTRSVKCERELVYRRAS